MSRKRIGLFFGSFNPPHIGHMAIANYIVLYGNIDELWFVVSPQNPLKEKKILVHSRTRLEMVRRAIGGYQFMRASDIEFNLPTPNFTINTLIHIEKKYPGRFSKATLRSTAQNLSSTWTKSGHLTGKARKTRVIAKATPGSVAYALFLGYLNGIRGQSLFTSEYATLLDCSPREAMALAEDASRRGWIIMKRVGNVVEVQFPKILTAQEKGWINDQD